MADFEKIAKELQEVNEQGLSRVSKLANMQLHIEERIDLLEKELKETKAELRAVAEDQLPAAMAEHNISELKLEDGSTISVSKFYSASIPKDRQEEAFGWLVTNNLPVNTKKWVEPMTLKAFIRDQVEKGNPIPMDTFGIYIGEKAKITKQKR